MGPGNACCAGFMVRKAEGESGTEEYTGRAEAGDDLRLYAAVRSVFKAIAELALGGDLILM